MTLRRTEVKRKEWISGALVWITSALFPIAGCSAPKYQEAEKVVVVIEDIAPYLKAAGMPELKGKAVFPCLLKQGRLEGVRSISMNCFDMKLSLKASLRRDCVAGEELCAKDLEDLSLIYTDDLVESRGISEKDIPHLIESLRQPDNRAKVEIGVIPGGEILYFSPPVKKLMLLGEKARAPLERVIQDDQIQNEVVLILGVIGDERTVRLLIDLFPKSTFPGDVNWRDPQPFKVVCWTFAVTYLTGQEIGRSREGTDFDREYKPVWEEWWKAHGTTFKVSPSKPNATWVPTYPSFQWAGDYREQFLKDLQKPTRE